MCLKSLFRKKEEKLFEDKPIPEVGVRYRFFDDGKTGYSRRYYATCLEVIPFKKAPGALKKRWKTETETCHWLYNPTTDYFIKCSIPHYEDELPVYFVRTLEGDWFSIDYPNDWMSGRLDVAGDYFTKAGWEGEEWSCPWD